MKKKRVITYGQHRQAIEVCAAYLIKKGIKKGDRIALLAEQSIDFLITVSAIHLAGAAAIPLEKNLAVKRISDIMKRLETNWLISYEDMEIPGVSILAGRDIKEYLSHHETPEVELSLPTPEILADILFTTGTTGVPKGIMVSHSANQAIAENVIDSVELLEDDIELIPTPINHSLGLRRYYGAMYRGSTAGIMDGVIYADDFFDMIWSYHVTAITLVPTMLSILLKFSKERLHELKDQLRFIQLGSSPVSNADREELCRQLPGVRLYNTYGATEAGCACILDFNKHRDKTFCIGRPTINTTISFVDDEKKNLKVTSKNCVGHMVLEGPMVMNGYWKDPALTAEVLQNNKIYTNDIGYMGEDGYVYLLGRKDDIINSGGNKIAPLEIEETVLRFPKIAECACVPVPDQTAGALPKLFIVMKHGEIFSQQEILSFLSERLEPFKVPKYMEELETLPRSYNGKILRSVLRERSETKT